MTITAGSTILADDFINESEGDATPANDVGKGVKLEADGKIDPRFINLDVETTAGTTHSLTTVAGQKVIVWVKGYDTHSTGSTAINLKYNGVVKDTITQGNTSGSTQDVPFALMYTETPGAATQNITVDGGTSLTNVVIIVLKI